MSRILVVDDDPAICGLLRTVLSRCGHDVSTATEGQTGVALFQQHHPEVVLLDLRQSGMEGIEVLKRIQVRGPSSRVIAMTVRGTEALVNQARRLGVTDFLNTAQLSQRVSRAGQPDGKTRPASAADAPAQASVLVVDDEPMVRDLLRQFLELSGHRVQEAANGAEALALAKRDRPSLIILDQYMPGMTGVDVLRRLGAQHAVLMLTASQDEKLLQEAWDLGLVALMGKPVDLDRLEVVVQVGLAVQGS